MPLKILVLPLRSRRLAGWMGHATAVAWGWAVAVFDRVASIGRGGGGA